MQPLVITVVVVVVIVVIVVVVVVLLLLLLRPFARIVFVLTQHVTYFDSLRMRRAFAKGIFYNTRFNFLIRISIETQANE